MTESDDLRLGWEFMAQILGAGVASQRAFSDYAANVAQNSAIPVSYTHLWLKANNKIDIYEKYISGGISRADLYKACLLYTSRCV